MSVQDKTILITGANRGLGRALVEEALRRGAKRVYAATRQPFGHPDSRVTNLPVDVTDSQLIRDAADKVHELDVLVNNAGLSVPDNLDTVDALERHLAINVFGTFTVSLAFLPLLERSRGAVVNIVSLAALGAVPLMPAYSLSKAALLSLTQSQRALWGRRGVTVHAVIPGPIDTEMAKDIPAAKEPPQSVARAVLDGVAAGDEDIFPDAMSAPLSKPWAESISKAIERQNAAYVPALM